jgi:hypothetical protein
MVAKRKPRPKPPWEKGNPKARAGKSKKLTPTEKSQAKKLADDAGRPYPNLVDNMRVAKKANKKAASKGR